MIDLAVVNRTETFQRIRKPLEDRGIRVRHVPVRGRTISLGTDAPWQSGEYDVGWVFPGRLMEGAVADELLGISWLNDRDAVLTSRNKAGVLTRLGRAGIPVPETVLVSNPVDDDDLVDVFERFDGPVVVKPNSTTRGVGVARAADLDSFLGIVDYLDLVHDFRATGDKSFLVQAFLPEAVDYRVMVLEGEYVGAVKRRLPESSTRRGRWKHNVHRGATAKGVSLPDEHRRLAETVAKSLDVRLLGVDLLATPERVVVNETNARPTIDEATKYEPGFFDRLAGTIEAVADAGTTDLS